MITRFWLDILTQSRRDTGAQRKAEKGGRQHQFLGVYSVSQLPCASVLSFKVVEQGASYGKL